MFTVDKEGVTFTTFEDKFSPTLLSLRKRAPLGIRFDPPRLFDVSVPPQLPRPPRMAPITATMMARRVCVILREELTQPHP